MRSYLLMWIGLVLVSLCLQPAAAQQNGSIGPASVAQVPPTAAAPQSLASIDVKGDVVYRLGAGDKVRITVYNEDSLSGEYEVDGSGNLSVPLIGAIAVVGKTVPDVIQQIQTMLKSGGYLLNPSVAVEVLSYRPFYVIGEIKQPGQYPYVSNMTVLNAVALAGGYTYRAKKDKVMIVRAGDPQRKEIAATPGEPVLPGDIIRVPERFF